MSCPPLPGHRLPGGDNAFCIFAAERDGLQLPEPSLVQEEDEEDPQEAGHCISCHSVSRPHRSAQERDQEIARHRREKASTALRTVSPSIGCAQVY